MSSIDERVVDMKFNNSQFQSGVQSTLSSLDKLKNGLKLNGATSGLDNLNKSASRFSLKGIAEGIGGVTSKFGALGVAGVAALATISSQAVMAGAQLVKAFTLQPILDGFHEYETQMNSIQTIMANTGREGNKGLSEVNDALNQLNTYSDKTIYNFTEMARNIGTFTAAGVDLNTSVSAIKGIANLAAVSGSSSQQASTAMYQLSQALASGTVKLMDWNSVVNAGMGGKVFQKALIQTAKVHGKNVDAMIKKEGSFRNTLQKGWLTSKILTETLKQFSGDYTKEQLKQMGYNDKQIKGILKMGKTATDAATKVKTFSQLVDTLKEATGSGWTQTFGILFGNFNEAKDLFTNVSKVLGGFISQSSKARNKVLGDWKALGGRTVLIKTIGDAFNDLVAVIKPIHDAFREIFPATTGKQLFELTKSLHDFVADLKIGGTTANNLKRTFAGVFAVFDMGWQVVKALAGVIGDLFGAIFKGSGGFLEFTGNIGDWLVNLDKAIKKGNGLTNFFKGLEKIVGSVAKAIGKVLTGLDFSGFEDVGRVLSSLNPLAAIGKRIVGVWEGVVKVFHAVTNFLAPVIQAIGEEVSGIWDALKDAFAGNGYQGVLDAINTGVLAGILIVVKKFFNGGFQKALKGLNPGSGLIDSIKDTFGALTDTMKAMQTQIQAKTLLTIAGAIAILVGSLVILSMIDSKKLTTALGGMAAAFGELMGAMAILTQISKSAGFLKIPLISSGLILLGGAILILSAAVKVLSGLSWNDLLKGLTGVGALLGMIVGTSKGLDKSSGSIMRAGLAMIPFALGIKILASAIKDMGSLSWSEIAKGLTTLSGALVAIGGAMNLMPKNMGLKATGILILSAAMKILASALQDMGGMTWGEIAKGLTTLAGALVIIGGALSLMPASLPGAAAMVVAAAAFRVLVPALQAFGDMSWEDIGKAMTVLAGSMVILAGGLTIMEASLPGAAAVLVAAAAIRVLTPALQAFGDMSWEEIAKGMVVLGGSIGILAAGLALMNGSIVGAAALIVAAGALAILAPVLTTLGGMSWEAIAKGMVAIAGAFTLIGVAGLVLTPVIPSILGLAAAIALLGAGAALLGAGALAIATAFGIIAAAGAAGITVLTGMINLIPLFMAKLAEGIGAFAVTIVQQSGKITAAFVALISSMLSAISTLAPQIVKTFNLLLDLAIGVIIRDAPKIAKAGVQLIDALLRAINGRIGSITKSAVDIIVKFANTLSSNMGRIVTAGVNLIVSLLNGIAHNVGRVVTAGTNIIVSFLNGIAHNIGRVVTAGVNIVVSFLNGVSNNMGRIADAGAKLVISFVNSVAGAIRNNSGAMGAAGANIGTAIIQGMASGIWGGISSVVSAAISVASSAISAAKHALGIHSPSREFIKIGNFVTQGFAHGIRGGKSDIDAAYKSLTGQLSTAMKDSAKDVATAEAKLKKLTSARHKDRKAIAEARKELTASKKELNAETTAHRYLTKYLDDEHVRLDKLAKSRDVLTAKISKETDVLKAAIKTRDDYSKSIRDQYSTEPDIGADTTLKDFANNLKNQIADTKLFAKELQHLRDLGLNNTLYEQLLQAGPDALPFMSQLEDQGRAGVKNLNSLSAQLNAVSSKLGTTSSRELYQAAVNSAQGILDGLKKQQANIEAVMNDIATSMVNTIKKKLKIHSPSKVFEEVGKFTNQGLAQGLDKFSGVVATASESVGETAIVSMQNALSKIPDALPNSMNLNPAIKPVLDLSGVKKDASQIGKMVGTAKISTAATYSKASDAQALFDGKSYAPEDNSRKLAPTTNVSLTQINNSPKALSTSEIYRNTKNQISTLKEALP